MRTRHINQKQLAEASGLTQGVISRAANPNYGNLTINTIIRVAAGFDMAFIGRFVPFSELENHFSKLSEDSLGKVATFDEEDAKREEDNTARAVAAATAERGRVLMMPSAKDALTGAEAGIVFPPFREIPQAKPIKAELRTPQPSAGTENTHNPSVTQLGQAMAKVLGL